MTNPQTTPDTEKIMKVIRTLDDVGRFSENLDYVLMAGEAREAIQRLHEKAWKYEELCK